MLSASLLRAAATRMLALPGARAASKAADKGGKGGVKGGKGGKVLPANKRRGAAPADGSDKIDDAKYRLQVATMYPPRPRDPPVIDFEERERRAFIAKAWSRYTQRRAHLRIKEETGLIRSQQAALAAMRAMSPQLVDDIKAKTAFEPRAPIERMPALTTPPSVQPHKVRDDLS